MIIAITLMCIKIAHAVETQVERDDQATHPLEKVVVIGASASAGWGLVLRYIDDEEMVVTRLVTMNDVLKACIRDDSTIVHGKGSGLFFWNPERMGERQSREAIDASPTLLFAIDYLFWFGYGNHGPGGTRIPAGEAGHDARLELLEIGLSKLDEFDCPVLVGDFPDMSEAVGRMLRSSQMPSAKTLLAMNERLREWASDRENVSVIPMSDMVESMRSNQPFNAGQQEWPAGSRRKFMQNDNLHPTLDGLIILVQESMVKAIELNQDLTSEDFDFNLDSVRVRIYERNRPDGTIPKPYDGVN